MLDLLEVASTVGDNWLLRTPQAEFVLSDASVPGEAEVKVFAALRAREAQQPGGHHAVYCGDGDAIIMALMLPASVTLTIDFGSAGMLRCSALRDRWVAGRLRRAGVPSPAAAAAAAAERGRAAPKRPRTRAQGPDTARGYPAAQLEGVQRDLAALILLDKGNDYLSALAIGVVPKGPDAQGTYFAMLAQPRWRHRTLLKTDPVRGIIAFDVEFLLRLLLDLRCRCAGGPAAAAAAKVLAASAGGGDLDEAAEAAALGVPLAAALQSGQQPGSEFAGAQVSDLVWAAWRAELPAEVQLEALVADATEPRVKAARDVLAESAAGGGGSANGSGPAAAFDVDGMRAALASVKTAMQPAAAAHLATVRWCLEMYGTSSCASFRILPPTITQPVSTQDLVALLALGWAEHVHDAARARPAAGPAAAAAAAVLRAGAPLRYGALVEHAITVAAEAEAAAPAAPAASADAGQASGAVAMQLPAETRVGWSRGVAKRLHAYLRHLEFGGAPPPKGPVVSSLTLPMLSHAQRQAPPAVLLYAPDYGLRDAAEWVRVAGPAEGAPAGVAAAQGIFGAADAEGPPLAVPWAQVPLLMVGDDVAEDAVAAMYEAAADVARSRVVSAPHSTLAHPLALLAPRLSYQYIHTHACVHDASSPLAWAHTHPAAVLACMLRRGGARAASALLAAADAFQRVGPTARPRAEANAPAGGRLPGAAEPGAASADSAVPAADLLWLQEVLQQQQGVAVGVPADTGAPARGTQPLSPLAHGLFMLRAEEALQLLPASVVQVLASSSGGDSAGNGAAGGAAEPLQGGRVIDSIRPDCALCTSTAALVSDAQQRVQQWQKETSECGAAAAAVKRVMRAIAAPVHALVATHGERAVDALWHEGAAAAYATMPAAKHDTLFALAAAHAASGQRAPPDATTDAALEGNAAAAALQTVDVLRAVLEQAWQQLRAGEGDPGANVADCLQHACGELGVQQTVPDMLATLQHLPATEAAAAEGGSEALPAAASAALAATFSLSGALLGRLQAIHQLRGEALDHEVAVFNAATAARRLHTELSHGPHEVQPPLLERSLQRLPLPPAATACTLATLRWVSSPHAAGPPPSPPAGTPVAGAASDAALEEARMGGAVAITARAARGTGPMRDVTVHEAYLLDRQAHACIDTIQPGLPALAAQRAAPPPVPRAVAASASRGWGTRGGIVGWATTDSVLAVARPELPVFTGAAATGVGFVPQRDLAVGGRIRSRRARAVRVARCGRVARGAR